MFVSVLRQSDPEERMKSHNLRRVKPRGLKYSFPAWEKRQGDIALSSCARGIKAIVTAMAIPTAMYLLGYLREHRAVANESAQHRVTEPGHRQETQH